jgi:putative toxin-antitoxin system antitoxin component (TIGR02293 family)
MRIASINLKAENTTELIHRLKDGLSTATFDKLKEQLQVSDHQLCRIIQIPKRTLDRRREKGRFKTDESERILRVARVFDMALAVFGKPEKARRWLKQPARGLDGHVPMEYADTGLGAQEVIDLLGRIDYGVFPG